MLVTFSSSSWCCPSTRTICNFKEENGCEWLWLLWLVVFGGGGGLPYIRQVGYTGLGCRHSNVRTGAKNVSSIRCRASVWLVLCPRRSRCCCRWAEASWPRWDDGHVLVGCWCQRRNDRIQTPSAIACDASERFWANRPTHPLQLIFKRKWKGE